jgi:hypothetical protein
VNPLTEPTDWVAGHTDGIAVETPALRRVWSDLAAETTVLRSETAERAEALTALANEMTALAKETTELAEQTNGLTVEMHRLANARELLTEPMDELAGELTGLTPARTQRLGRLSRLGGAMRRLIRGSRRLIRVGSRLNRGGSLLNRTRGRLAGPMRDGRRPAIGRTRRSTGRMRPMRHESRAKNRRIAPRTARSPVISRGTDATDCQGRPMGRERAGIDRERRATSRCQGATRPLARAT